MEVKRPLVEVRDRTNQRLIGWGCLLGANLCAKIAAGGRPLGIAETLFRQPVVAKVAVKIGQKTNLFTENSRLMGAYVNLMDRTDRDTDRRKIVVAMKFAEHDMRKQLMKIRTAIALRKQVMRTHAAKAA